jgi:hypothetical protein
VLSAKTLLASAMPSQRKKTQAIIIHGCANSIVILRDQPLSQSTLTERL